MKRAERTAPVAHAAPVRNETANAPSRGQPLEAALRREMERTLGRDFSRVRIHQDSQAANAAAARNALAYTEGEDIMFAAGQYRPNTPEGRRLIAHELAHVVQQRARIATGVQRRPPWLDRSDKLERDAEDGVAPRRPGSTMTRREFLENVIPPARKQPPAAAQVKDERAAVLATDRKMFDDLRTYIESLPQRLRTLVKTGDPTERWLVPDNKYVQSALRVLDALAQAMKDEAFVIRFDQAAAEKTAASYDSLNDLMHLRQFASAGERTQVASDLLHEYAHVLQDREAEEVFARDFKPHAETRKEALQQEIDARREHVYFAEMLRVLNEPKPPVTNETFHRELSDRLFRARFETERTGKTAKKRKAATAEISKELAGPYEQQLAKNTSIKSYAIEITDSNHALLHWDLPRAQSPRDLGEAPAEVKTHAALQAHVEPILRALAEFERLFDRSPRERAKILTFRVLYDGRQVMEFGMEEHP